MTEVERICLAALDRPAEERAQFVADACHGDDALRQDVESLLAHASPAEQFIEQPAVAGAGALAGLSGLSLGQRLGPYQIVARLGAGGMGEVYRARDTQLGREVAIKVLPVVFATDPERLARFEREARVLASLNHPHIAAIYGLEAGPPEAGTQNRALVMELVEGLTLADRISQSAIRLPEVLAIAGQIADALAAAHEKGIVHRDLKPANIKVTPDGVVKVLDFGLAKLVALEVDRQVTLTATREGLIVGTPAYMSPEQARGQATDKRTDIWAFGCVLYEMLTARAAFAGETVTDTLAAILERDPDWSALPNDVPSGVRRLLARCLHRDARARLRDIGDWREFIEPDDPVAASPSWRRAGAARLPWAIALVALAAAATATGWMWWGRAAAAGSLGAMTRLTWDAGYTTDPNISADGSLIAYASDRGAAGLDIWVQQTSGGPPVRLTSDVEDDLTPDISPDRSRVAYASNRHPSGVYVVPALGGDPRLIAPDGHQPKFSPDGRSLVFWKGRSLAPRSVGNVRSVWIVPADGGEAVEVVTGLASAGDPVWSPDGRSLLVFGRAANSGEDLQTDWWVVVPGSGRAVRTGAYDRLQASGVDVRAIDDQPYPNSWTERGVLFVGRLVDSDSRSVWLIPVDSTSARVSGAPQRMTTNTSVDASPSLARDGRLVFGSLTRQATLLGLPIDANTGTVTGALRTLRQGGAALGRAALSADGRSLVFYATALGRTELWIRDLPSGRERQLAVTPPAFMNPVISRDGRWVAYTVTRDLRGASTGGGDGFVIASEGGSPRKICDQCEVFEWLDNGRRLFVQSRQTTRMDVLDIASGTRHLVMLANVDRPLPSSDGRWLSLNLGSETMVAPLHPDKALAPAELRQVIDGTTMIGRNAGWSPDGRLLYVLLEMDGFRCLYVIPIDQRSGRAAGPPREVHHFHAAHLRWGSTGFGTAVAGGLFLSNQILWSGNIWMTTLETASR